MTNYENFNSSLSSFRIFCDKLTSNNMSNNLILESINNNIEFKVPINKKILFNNNVALNILLDIDSNINITNDEGNTPLHIAVYNNNIDNINIKFYIINKYF